MTHHAHTSGSRVALRTLSCGWVLMLCVGIAMWMGGFGSDMALLSAGSLCVTRAMLSDGTRKKTLRLLAAGLLLTAAWTLAVRLALFAG
jgi:hypothetical protein